MLLQKVGDIQLRVFTDGYPLRFELTDLNNPDTDALVLHSDDLHDLRYAIDRMLIKVAEHEQRRR